MAVGAVAVGEGIITGGGEIIGVGAIPGGVEAVGVGVITGEDDGGTEDDGILRVQAVTTIVPIPINNLKYLTLDLTLKVREVTVGRT